MSRRGQVELWRKAAVLGSLWAASEIVFGSFLHNARVPFSGNILTGIGIATLVAGHRLWPQRGLLWRAGLVCAAMKSISPSAVILSPMIAIAAEGFLMEAGVALAGGNLLGYLLAGGLAMSWPLAHRLGGTVLFYGPETLSVYVKGIDAVRSWLGLAPGSPWTPLLVLWALHAAGGFLSAGVGMSVGVVSGGESAPSSSALKRGRLESAAGALPESQTTVTALILHLVCVAGVMAWGSRAGVPLLAVAAAAYCGLCVLRYPRAGRMARRVSLWGGLLAAAVLAGLVLGRWQAGAQMGLRALVLTVGFACIGTELRNPALRLWLERAGGRMFLVALEQAFDTLPEVFAGLPSGARLLKSPAASLRAALARAPSLLESLVPARVLMVTGSQGEGKSELIAALAARLRAAGSSLGGIHAPGFWEEGRRSGFDLVDLGGGGRVPLCRTDGPECWPSQGPFRFSPEGLAFGCRALEEAVRRDPDVVVVDEVGPLELRGQGWALVLDALARKRRKPMVWVVRQGLIDEVRLRWGLAEDGVWDAGTGKADALADSILADLERGVRA